MGKSSTIVANEWAQLNQDFLSAELQEIYKILFKKVYPKQNFDEINIKKPDNITPAIKQLSHIFSLSSFECKLLLLCVGVELDSRIATLCAKIHDDKTHAYPTLGLAFDLFEKATWDVLTPQSPLRYWRLIEFDPNIALSLAPLKISERILHYLLGNVSIDEHLTVLLTPSPENNNITASQASISKKIITIFSESIENPEIPLINLVGSDLDSKRIIAKNVAEKIGCNLYIINHRGIAEDAKTLENLWRLLEREAILSNIIYLLEIDFTETKQSIGLAMKELATRLHKNCLVSTVENLSSNKCCVLNLQVNKPTQQEQQKLWQNNLIQFENNQLNEQEIEQISSQFSLSVMQINNICKELKNSTDDPSENILDRKIVWQACRKQLRSEVAGLVRIIEPKAQWEDLILPDEQKDILRQMLAQVMQCNQVYQHWGFSEKSFRGSGISALFSGPSGVGKTLAAEVLASTLQLDLYYIDLSAVISKYIGETEKNLKKIFDIAEDSGAILLFDEADALFGKRSEVKDSHDRHANIETSYLLQKMENYSGLSILTTNLKENIDNAFMRRIRFIVPFSFPDAIHRAKIWRQVLPEKLPTADLAIEKLSDLNISGGNIYSIALNAAFKAASDQKILTMQHLYQATKDEYIKLEKMLPEWDIED